MTKKKNGRPKIEIDWEEFDRLCEFQCTLLEIASWLKCSDRTVERRVEEEKGMGFVDYYKIASAGGKRSLRRKQFEIAEAGNVGMCIWLGKQYLGQSDKIEEKSTRQVTVSDKPLTTEEWEKEFGDG